MSVLVRSVVESIAGQETTGGTAAKVPIVGTTGCLAQVADGGWRLANATDTVVEPLRRRRRLNNDNAPATPVAPEKPARMSGPNNYMLIGVDEFNPAAHKGHVGNDQGIVHHCRRRAAHQRHRAADGRAELQRASTP